MATSCESVIECFTQALGLGVPRFKSFPELLRYLSTFSSLYENKRDLLSAAALFERGMILQRGQVPITEVCMICKIQYGAKEGGEPYPPERRMSHGYCPPCYMENLERMREKP